MRFGCVLSFWGRRVVLLRRKRIITRVSLLRLGVFCRAFLRRWLFCWFCFLREGYGLPDNGCTEKYSANQPA